MSDLDFTLGILQRRDLYQVARYGLDVLGLMRRQYVPATATNEHRLEHLAFGTTYPHISAWVRIALDDAAARLLKVTRR